MMMMTTMTTGEKIGDGTILSSTRKREKPWKLEFLEDNTGT